MGISVFTSTYFNTLLKPFTCLTIINFSTIVLSIFFTLYMKQETLGQVFF